MSTTGKPDGERSTALTPDEARGLAAGLLDFAEGRTTSLADIRHKLADADTRKDSGLSARTGALATSAIEGERSTDK